MKKIFYTIVILAALISNVKAQAPGCLWAKTSQSIIVDNTSPCRIAFDEYKNSYVIGTFESTAIFGNITLYDSVGQGPDFYLVKTDSTGAFLWARKVTGAYYNIPLDIAVDAQGNAYLTGYFQSKVITFDNITVLNSDTASTTSLDVFIAKYNPSGNVLWVRKSGPESIFFESQAMANDIALDANGGVYITGYFENGISFGNDTLQNNINPNDATSFIAKYDTAGNELWAKKIYDSNNISYNIATDAIGGVFISGTFKDSIRFGNITLVASNNGPFDFLFTAKYDASGNVIWANRGGYVISSASGGFAFLRGTMDGNGNYYVGGSFAGDSAIFDSVVIYRSDNLTNTLTSFVMKYNSSGTLLWINACGGDGSVELEDIVADANNNFYITGTYWGSHVHFGNDTLSPAPNEDIFCAKFNGNGNPLWALGTQTSSNNWADGNGIAVDASSHVYITGFYEANSIDFGNVTLIGDDSYINVFIAKLDTANVVTKIQTQTSNQYTLYPNPTTNQLTITSQNKIDEITITDVLGSLIEHAKPDNKTVSLAIDNNGLYFVTIISNGERTTKKVVVHR